MLAHTGRTCLGRSRSAAISTPRSSASTGERFHRSALATARLTHLAWIVPEALTSGEGARLTGSEDLQAPARRAVPAPVWWAIERGEEALRMHRCDEARQQGPRSAGLTTRFMNSHLDERGRTEVTLVTEQEGIHVGRLQLVTDATRVGVSLPGVHVAGGSSQGLWRASYYLHEQMASVTSSARSLSAPWYCLYASE